MTQSLYTYGGDGPPMHMALANGFPPQTYSPLLQPLTTRYRVVSLPPRPMWPDPPAPETLRTWDDTADDLLAGLEQHNLTNVVGIGHSLGAVATMIAATKQPGRFKAIILLDPTIFPPHVLWVFRAMQALGLQARLPLVQKTLNRRDYFQSEQEAFDYWRGKRLFHDWPDETLWHYVRGLTTPDGNGALTLAWPKAWEARYYATPYTESWRLVPQLEGLLPVLVLRGTESNTFFADAARQVQRIAPSLAYAEIGGHGHLFPQSAPDETRAVIESWLA